MDRYVPQVIFGVVIGVVVVDVVEVVDVVDVVVCYRVGVDGCIGDNRSCCSINSLMNN